MNIVYEKPFKIGYPWKPKANSDKHDMKAIAAPEIPKNK
jgi:hypothetical protein